jgi:hypothetical protein
MTYEAWPSPDAARGPLPRIEDLPIADQGYDQESVREAFDSFYRHAAQLDASLKALEAVEVFRRDAYELRNDLRALRSFGFGASEPSSAWTPRYSPEGPRFEIPSAVPRLAFEAGLIVAVAVIAGVAHFRWWLIVALLAAAWAIVGISEWIAGRARFAVPTAPGVPAATEGLHDALEDTAAAWLVQPEPEPEAEPAPSAEGLTVVVAAEVEPAPEEAEVEAEPEPEAQVEAADEPEPEPEAPAAVATADDVSEADGSRRRWFRRRSEHEPEREEAAGQVANAAAILDPWEHEAPVEAAAGAQDDDHRSGRLRRRR